MIPEDKIIAAKSVYERAHIFDKTIFNHQIQQEVNKINKGGIAKRIILIVAASIIPLMGVAYAADKYLTTSSYKQLTIQEGLRRVDFSVDQPSYLPFTVARSWSDLISVKSKKDIGISIVYANANKSIIETVTESVSNADFSIIPEPQDGRNVDMGNGISAIYSDQQGKVVWQNAGYIYSLQDIHGTKTRGPFLTASQLFKIARSIK